MGRSQDSLQQTGTGLKPLRKKWAETQTKKHQQLWGTSQQLLNLGTLLDDVCLL